MDCDPCRGQRMDVDVTGDVSKVGSIWARSHVYFLRKFEMQHVCAGIKGARSMVLTHNTAACIWMKQNPRPTPFVCQCKWISKRSSFCKCLILTYGRYNTFLRANHSRIFQKHRWICIYGPLYIHCTYTFTVKVLNEKASANFQRGLWTTSDYFMQIFIASLFNC